MTGDIDVAAAARRLIRHRDDLRTGAAYPADLWRGLAGAGLLGLTVPVRHGGRGWDLARLGGACRDMVRHGRSLGAALAWKSHNTLAHFVLVRLGDEAQRRHWLPRLAAGETTLSVAISEPGAGAHPGRLSARAERTPDGWRLTGTKAWLTNGPMAGLFVVVAVVGETEGRKRYGAFLVPADAPGLMRTEAGGVDFLRPTGHCGLRLDSVEVPPGAQLAPDRDAYDVLARPLRGVEDLLGLGSAWGAMEALTDSAAESGADEAVIGGLAARIVSFAALAGPGGGDDAVLLAARCQQADFLAEFRGLGLPPEPGRDALLADLAASARVARYVHDIRLRALGRRWAGDRSPQS